MNNGKALHVTSMSHPSKWLKEDVGAKMLGEKGRRDFQIWNNWKSWHMEVGTIKNKPSHPPHLLLCCKISLKSLTPGVSLPPKISLHASTLSLFYSVMLAPILTVTWVSMEIASSAARVARKRTSLETRHDYVICSHVFPTIVVYFLSLPFPSWATISFTKYFPSAQT